MSQKKFTIGVIISSTREGRMGERVAHFVKKAIEKDHIVDLIDPLEVHLTETQQSMNFMFNPGAVPDNIKALNDRIKALDALVLVCAEYNYSIPPGLSNLLDNIPFTTTLWKPVAFVNYSIGPFGGTRAAMQLRVFVGALGMIAVPKQVAIPVVNEALDEHGTPKNDKLNQELSMLLSHLYWATDALKSQAAKSPYPQHFPS
ncbi:quinone reductase-like [Dreissena polymorpha]|uniref:NADPH-dependent FMN reductase-like domain-containing protein n=1 Tax=Dreissena polymorpha TaxID=45954 RepID=A0A9D4DRC7_DREPO|nr:quinone reductase-like [Dreissena polymorpha]XP_052236741.1 quinone reductase-like [Dreissena polymorpha]KAH3752707.1 hypothetical protein DPMN_187333 [Dreissena polymorpha]